MRATPNPVQVAVLGGGLGAMSAAFRLTDPDLDGRFAVTVYQQGWRLGGKGASGRNRAMGDRIEEHGLHLFMGWYDQAFRLIRDCYAEWDPPAGSPIHPWDRAFVPERRVVICENLAPAGAPANWDLWDLPFPRMPGIPGDPRDGNLHPVTFLRRLVGWLAEPARTLALGLQDGGDEATWHGHRVALRFDETNHHRHTTALLGALEGLATTLHRTHGIDPADVAAELRQAWILLRLGLAFARGLLVDVVPHGHEGWSRIDHLDLKDWLATHGAPTPEVSFSAPVRLFYDLAFAFVDGDTSDYHNAQVAAGAATRTLLRTTFGYRDAPLWRMTAGMGDVVFAPLYQVLAARGVRFEFFTRVDALHLGHDRTTVESIDLVRQAALTDDAYRPLYRINDHLDVWPSQPLWDQVRNGHELEARDVDFESFWCHEQVRPDTLRAGADFDAVVLGISLGGLPFVASELIAADRRWHDMVERIGTVETQSVQLWTRPDLAGLGWRQGPMVGSAYQDPFDSFADMSQVLPNEGWGTIRPGAVEYLVAPLQQRSQDPWSDPHYPSEQLAAVRANAVAWLGADAGRIWPALAGSDGVDWSVLFDPDDAPGQDRLTAQYLRANVDPSERYVLTPPGTVGLRLDPADSGFTNLYPAGDWVRTSVNGGSAEAAVEGGTAAAAALRAHYP